MGLMAVIPSVGDATTGTSRRGHGEITPSCQRRSPGDGRHLGGDAIRAKRDVQTEGVAGDRTAGDPRRAGPVVPQPEHLQAASFACCSDRVRVPR
jgi:hypothetical protein